jgi:predicted metalloendopeptidase
MSPPTRAKALEKMSAFGVKIGFPNRWIDYAPLGIVAGDHLGNVLRARAFEFKRRVRTSSPAEHLTCRHLTCFLSCPSPDRSDGIPTR